MYFMYIIVSVSIHSVCYIVKSSLTVARS